MDVGIRTLLHYLAKIDCIVEKLDKLLDKINNSECNECFDVMFEENISYTEYEKQNCKHCIYYTIKQAIIDAKVKLETLLEKLYDHIYQKSKVMKE